MEEPEGASAFLDFVRSVAGFFVGVTVAPTLGFFGRSGSPRIRTIALSDMIVWCSTGILTATLHTGHLPVFPAFDSLAVKWCPLGHFN